MNLSDVILTPFRLVRMGCLLFLFELILAPFTWARRKLK